MLLGTVTQPALNTLAPFASASALHEAWKHARNLEARAAILAAARHFGASSNVHPAWQAMRAAAEDEGLRVYVSDLYVHDAATLELASPKDTFVWAVGATGTYLEWVERGESTYGAATRTRTVVDLCPSMHFWDGQSFKRVDADTFRLCIDGKF